MGDYGFVIGGVFITIMLFYFLSSYSLYYAPINCPNIMPDLELAYSQGGSIEGFINMTTTLIGVLASPCSGIPWYIWLIPFLVLLAFIVWIVYPIISAIPFFG